MTEPGAHRGAAGTDTLVNLRDLGGLPLLGGGITATGVLLRSDAPYDGDETPVHVTPWPPATVIDLRSDKEVARSSYEWGDDTRVRHHPLHASAAPDALPRDADLAALYTYILDTVPERVTAIMAIAAREPGPVLVHCAAGKDRTGIVVAALLLAADVTSEAVVADYVATAANMEVLRRRWRDKGIRTATGRPLRNGWLLAPEAAIMSVVDRLTNWPHGTAGWLRDHGADAGDIEMWRSRLAAGVPR